MNKIAYVLANFETGGMSNFTYRLAKNLKNKYELFFISIQVNTIPEKFNEIGTVKIFCHDWFGLYFFLKSENISIVQFSDYRIIADVSISAGVPIIIERMDGFKNGDILSNKKDLSAVVASTKSTVGSISKLIGLKKIYQIYNGIDIKESELVREKRLDIKDSDIIIGRVSVLHPGKNISLLIESFKILLKKHQNIKLVIVGGNSKAFGYFDEFSQLKKLSKDIKEKVYFTGYVNDPLSFVKGFDIATCTSKRGNEGIPNSLIESFALGKPVVSTNVDDIKELVDHDVNGILVKDDDVNEFASALDRLINDESLRHKYGKAGYSKVDQFFDINIQSEKYLNMYEELLLNDRNKNQNIISKSKYLKKKIYYFFKFTFKSVFIKYSPKIIKKFWNKNIITYLKRIRSNDSLIDS